MKEQLPAPDFDRQNYERPNQDWICGWTCDGKPCRIGPSPQGECRAKAECRPMLDKKAWEEKGRWRCTLPKEHGGPCETGPLPDGRCCRPIPPCAPARSLRAQRGLFCKATVAFLLGFLLVAFYSGWAWNFISPGQVSSPHRGAAFAALRPVGGASEGCAACHSAAQGGPVTWLQAGLTAQPGPFQIINSTKRHPHEFNQIDRSCVECHTGHNFHQPNTIRDHSCSACHREHEGGVRMLPPESAQCATCHNDVNVMQASFEKAQGLPRDAFDLHRTDGLFVFLPERPKYGRGQIFATFSGDHPEFQLHREKLNDSDTLKFNHAKHFAGAVPLLDGHKLDCKDCHRPDSAGKYFQRIAYETHCQSCHSLQFDGENPSLTLPHGDASAVRAFLRTLPVQYAELARSQGLSREPEIEQFAQTNMARLRRLASSGENLEQQIFYTADPAKPLPTAANAPAGRAKFAGCAYCHEVKTTRDGTPAITRPRIPDRWMPLGEFNHSKHTNVSCNHCHAAEQSSETSDILVPTKATCATCHSQSGGTSESCALCHTFHTAADKPSALRRR